MESNEIVPVTLENVVPSGHKKVRKRKNAFNPNNIVLKDLGAKTKNSFKSSNPKTKASIRGKRAKKREVKTLKKALKNLFPEYKINLLKRLNSLVKFGIIDKDLESKISNSRSFGELKNFDLLNILYPRMLEFINLFDKKKLETKVNNFQKIFLSDLTKEDKKNIKSYYTLEEIIIYYNNLITTNRNLVKSYEDKNSELIKDIRNLKKELNKYRTPSKKIKDELEGYIELIKKEPDKKPTVDSLADFSKGKSFELGKTRWSELIKSYKFVVGIIGLLDVEYDKTWDKVGKNNEKIKDIGKEIKECKNEQAVKKLNNKIKVLNNNSESLEGLAKIFESIKKEFNTNRIRIERSRTERIPKIEQIIDKKAIETMCNVTISNSDFKKLELELKNVIFEFLQDKL